MVEGIEKSEKEKAAEKELEQTYKEIEEQEKREELSTLKVFKFQNEGDKINGILLELTTIPTQYSNASPFAKLKTDDGIYGIFLPYELKQVLIPDLIGERIEIVFKSWIPTKSGRKMKKFSVFKIGNKHKQENNGKSSSSSSKESELEPIKNILDKRLVEEMKVNNELNF